ncbi:MAG: metallophosphoesterase [Acetobacteraceae bacterium]
MRVAVISEIHGNIEALSATLRSIAAETVDRIVCLGDIVGYNTDPEACIAAIREHDVLCVAGNHDRAVCGKIGTEDFSPVAARAVAWTRQRLSTQAVAFLEGLPLVRCVDGYLVAVHGALHPPTGQDRVRLDNAERRRMTADALLTHSSGARICAFGHTHLLGIHEYWRDTVSSHHADEVRLRADAVYLINPGSIGQPRTAERRATYLVVDTQSRMIVTRRVAYDAGAAFGKTIAAGLMPRPLPLPAPVRSALKRGTTAVGLYPLLRKGFDGVERWRNGG